MKLLNENQSVRLIIWRIVNIIFRPGLLFIFFIIYILYNLSPFYSEDSKNENIETIQNSGDLSQFVNETKLKVEKIGQEITRQKDFFLNPLIKVNAQTTALGLTDGSIETKPVKYTIKIRTENLILLSVSSILILWVLNQLINLPTNYNNARIAPEISEGDSIEAVMLNVIKRLMDEANDFDKKSNLLLIVGIMLALVGIVVFAFSLPEIQETENNTIFLLRGLRAFGILLFIESIAWFLLRQYRALIEDYKYFYDRYLNKTAFLIAEKKLSSGRLSETKILFLNALLTADNSEIPKNIKDNSDFLTENFIRVFTETLKLYQKSK